MDYVKVIENGYILAVGSGIENGVPITEEEYNAIIIAIQAKPPRTEAIDYRLRDDLTWEAYEIESPEPEPEEIDEAEALSIILGGAI